MVNEGKNAMEPEFYMHSQCCNSHWELVRYKDGTGDLLCEKCGLSAGKVVKITFDIEPDNCKCAMCESLKKEKPKLTIHHRDGSETEVEPIKMWDPKEPGNCESCGCKLGRVGGMAGTGLCGPCCTGESETLEEKYTTW